MGEVFLEIRNGKNVKQISEKGKYRVTRIETIANGTVNLEKTKWTNDEPNEKDFLQNGDILFSHINSIEHLAKTAIFLGNEKVVHGINLIRLRPNKTKILPLYAIYLFKSDQFISIAKKYAQKAVNQASIKVSDIKQIQIPLPPLEIQKQIVAELDSYQKIIDGARQVIENWKPKIKIDPDWPKVKFQDVCTLEYGASLPKKIRKKGPYPVMGSNGISGFHNEYLIKGPAIIVGRKGSAGEVTWVEENCFPIDTTYYVKLTNPEKTNLKFVYYVLQSLDLTKLKGGAGIPGLNRNDVYEKYRFPLPDIKTQQQIVSEIEKEQKIIDQLKELIKIYEQKIKDKIAEVWGE